MFEDFGVGVQCARAADDHPQIIFAEAEFFALFAALFAAGSEVDRIPIDGPGACHDRVGAGAEFHEEVLVGLAGERLKDAIGRGDFAIGGDREIDINERQAHASGVKIETQRIENYLFCCWAGHVRAILTG